MNFSIHHILLRPFVVMLLLCCATLTRGQDRLEVGLQGGVGYYLGEFNPHGQFVKPGVAVGGLVRYIFTDRIALRGQCGYTRIRGEYDGGSEDVYAPTHSSPVVASKLQDGATETVRALDAEFANNLIDISCLAEVNFLSFDHMFRKEQTRFSPFVAVGLGCTAYSKYCEDNDKKKVFVLSLPFSVGAKYKVNKFMRLGLEWMFHKTFTDDLDSYATAGGNFVASDPYGNGEHVLTHNNDWFSNFVVHVSFSMWPRKLVCNDGLRTFYRE